MAARVISDNDSSNHQSTKPRFSGLHILVGILGILVVTLAVALVSLLMRVPNYPQPVEDGWSGKDWVAARSEPVVREVADGLGQTDTVVGTAARSYKGWPVGWDNSLSGRVAQTGVIAAFWESMDSADPNKSDLHAMITGNATDQDFDFKWYREDLGIDEKGHILDNDGNPIPDKTLICAAYPRYGAYKIIDVTFLEDHSIEDVVVLWWLPIVKGYKSVSTNQIDFHITWETRLIYSAWNKETKSVKEYTHTFGRNLPQPDDPTKVNQPFSVRAELLGPGWVVPADATEEPLPGVWGAK